MEKVCNSKLKGWIVTFANVSLVLEGSETDLCPELTVERALFKHPPLTTDNKGTEDSLVLPTDALEGTCKVTPFQSSRNPMAVLVSPPLHHKHLP